MADEDKPKRTVQLNGSRMQLRESVVQDYVVTVEPGINEEDILRPDFWAHVAWKLSPYDEITVRSDDGTLYCKCIVLTCSRTWAKVRIFEQVALTTADVDMSQDDTGGNEDYLISWGGPHHKWRIVRKSDNAMIKNGFQDKTAAMVELRSILKVMS